MAATTEPVAAVAPTVAVTNQAESAAATNLVASTPEPAAAKAPVVTEPPQPKPVPLRLQAILYNPQRPSIIVSGKTLYVGDRIREFRVTAIDQTTATLVAAGQTNVLEVP